MRQSNITTEGMNIVERVRNIYASRQPARSQQRQQYGSQADGYSDATDGETKIKAMLQQNKVFQALAVMQSDQYIKSLLEEDLQDLSKLRKMQIDALHNALYVQGPQISKHSAKQLLHNLLQFHGIKITSLVSYICAFYSVFSRTRNELTGMPILTALPEGFCKQGQQFLNDIKALAANTRTEQIQFNIQEFQRTINPLLEKLRAGGRSRGGGNSFDELISDLIHYRDTSDWRENSRLRRFLPINEEKLATKFRDKINTGKELLSTYGMSHQEAEFIELIRLFKSDLNTVLDLQAYLCKQEKADVREDHSGKFLADVLEHTPTTEEIKTELKDFKNAGAGGVLDDLKYYDRTSANAAAAPIDEKNILIPNVDRLVKQSNVELIKRRFEANATFEAGDGKRIDSLINSKGINSRERMEHLYCKYYRINGSNMRAFGRFLQTMQDMHLSRRKVTFDDLNEYNIQKFFVLNKRGNIDVAAMGMLEVRLFNDGKYQQFRRMVLESFSSLLVDMAKWQNVNYMNQSEKMKQVSALALGYVTGKTSMG